MAGGRAARGATRKVAAKKRPRRVAAWFNRVLILSALAIVTVVTSRGYIALQEIPVQRVTVTGKLAHTQKETVQHMVQPALVGGFLRADLQRIRDQLEDLPWIYRAAVRRQWPNVVAIHVVEQLPIARWGQSGFLNHEGELFHSDREGDWASLPLLQGPAGTARTLMGTYRRMTQMLTPLGLKVDELRVDERGQIEARLPGKMQLLLGGSDFRERMQRFVMLYRKELAQRDIERIDLRYHSGVAVAFREPSLVAGL
jgi:cell division protein FtsQ